MEEIQPILPSKIHSEMEQETPPSHTTVEHGSFQNLGIHQDKIKSETHTEMGYSFCSACSFFMKVIFWEDE